MGTRLKQVKVDFSALQTKVNDRSAVLMVGLKTVSECLVRKRKREIEEEGWKGRWGKGFGSFNVTLPCENSLRIL